MITNNPYSRHFTRGGASQSPGQAPRPLNNPRMKEYLRQDKMVKKTNASHFKTSYEGVSASNYRRGGGFLIYLYWLLGGLATVAIIYFISAFLMSTSVKGQLVYLEGEVQIKNGPDAQWGPAKQDQKIRKYDELKTMGGARAIVSFDDGSLVRLSEFTRLIFTDDNGNLSIIQTDGRAYHRVVKSDKKKYLVKFNRTDGGSDVVVESLGTAFVTEKIGPENNILLIEGKIKYSLKDTTEELSEGQKITISGTSKNLKDIEKADLDSDFIAWNLDLDRKKNLNLGIFVNVRLAGSTEPAPAPTTPDNSSAPQENQDGVVISGKASEKGVELEWDLNGVKDSNGIKILKGSNVNPEYPGSYYRSIKSSASVNNAYIWDTTDGQTYHFRICIFDGASSCSKYSNDLEIKTIKVEGDAAKKCTNSGGTWTQADEDCDCPSGKTLKNEACVAEDSSTTEAEKNACKTSGGTWDDDDEDCTCPSGESLVGTSCKKENFATGVTLTADAGEEKVTLSWKLKDGEAPYGYYVVRSKSKNPEYGDNTSPLQTDKQYTYTGLTSDTTYYFRVCVWDKPNSKCKIYSANETAKPD